MRRGTEVGRWSALVVAAALAAACGKSPSPAAPARVKIGFLVKQAEEPWFQNEWKFARQAAAKLGFDLVEIAVPDGERALSAIDNLAAQGAQGFVICAPDVRLGPAIVAKAQAHGLKVMSVDDQFVGADGAFLDVPHMGISASEIGKMVGQALHAEMRKRGWKPEETALCLPTVDQLETARQRTEACVGSLVEAGFPRDRVFRSAQKTTDVPGGIDAANIVLTQHPDVKKWLACGTNDEAVLGVVRATETRSIPAENVIGIGIGGSTGKVDFEKERPTGFFATVLINPKRHGYETSELMYRWIKDGVPPPRTTFTTGTLITRENWKTVMKAQELLD